MTFILFTIKGVKFFEAKSEDTPGKPGRKRVSRPLGSKPTTETLDSSRGVASRDAGLELSALSGSESLVSRVSLRYNTYLAHDWYTFNITTSKMITLSHIYAHTH